jgi:LCP family protein required for cell wall assembly
MRKTARIFVILISLFAFCLTFTVFDFQNSAGAAAAKKPPAPAKPADAFSILILGTDQRASEKNFRTDVIMAAILRPSVKKAVIVSFPRDLNYAGRKVNSLYPLKGDKYTKLAFSQMIGISIDRYITVNGFNSFVWAINEMNGLDVNVERAFTDKQYPGDRENWGPLTLEFKAGPQHMDGERALKYARSRKGNNGEGSDFGRMKRQQNILMAMPEAFLSNRKSLIPFSAQALLDLITGKIRTDIGITDIDKLYTFLTDYRSWNIERLVLDTKYLYEANAKNYGGAYTLLPRGGSYLAIRNFIYQKLQ